MKLKTFIALSLIATSTFCFGQESNNQETKKSRFGHRTFLGVGNSTLEHNQFGLLNCNVWALSFNVDYSLTKSEKTKLVSGIQVSGSNGGFFDGTKESVLKNAYMQIPLKLVSKLSLDDEEKLNFVSGIGTYANFLYYSHIWRNGDDDFNTKSGGVNMGYSLLLGLEYRLSPDTAIGVNADVMGEFSAISKNGYEQKQTEIYLFSVGFSQRF